MTNRAGWVVVVFTVLALPWAGCRGQDGDGFTDEQLAVMIDSLLPPIAEASGLAVRRPVGFAMQSPEAVRQFVESQLAKELGPEELAGMTRSYKRLGLLPEELDLRALLLDLYTEQVVGYYDPETDRLYVVEGVTAETAAPVVAHELVHALQDQHAPLDSLVSQERGNDRQMAAQAAAEGQATLVMLALQAAESAGEPIDPASLPDLEPLMRPALEAENSRFPVFQNAPRLIRETLLFPYLGGAGFLQALYRARPAGARPVPFGELLPGSTEQVLEPERAFLDERDVPTELGLGEEAGGWAVVYTNTLGQLETGILLGERTGGERRPGASGWDGDRYALLEGPDGEEALVWYSVWDDASAADRVAGVLRAPGDWRVERFEREGRPFIRVVIASEGVDPSVPGLASAEETPTR
jgi:hypothetical protein